ncbi:hypothetical protein AXF42_Ash010230 [Apostasia shenzhenica]|uniref:Uncharacterized protein n=1 Tax=Apostasia shenzhenica TaxID=1088818 RepID=A0A2I0A9X1_9ASPA|nr:hypothetical protein AXF42_Ash010230 [Apostasia shenzhenica]
MREKSFHGGTSPLVPPPPPSPSLPFERTAHGGHICQDQSRAIRRESFNRDEEEEEEENKIDKKADEFIAKFREQI